MDYYYKYPNLRSLPACTLQVSSTRSKVILILVAQRFISTSLLSFRCSQSTTITLFPLSIALSSSSFILVLINRSYIMLTEIWIFFFNSYITNKLSRNSFNELQSAIDPELKSQLPQGMSPHRFNIQMSRTVA